MATTEVVINLGKDANHQFVRNKIALVDKTLGGLTQLCTILNLITEHITCGDMPQSIVLNHQIALCPLS